MRKISSNQKIKLICIDNVLYLNPWLPELSDTLTCFRRKTKPGRGSKAMEVVYIPEQLYYVSNHSKPTVGVTYGGFFNRVVSKLDEWKIRFEIEDHQSSPPAVDLSVIKDVTLRPGQDKVIHSILTNNRGIIKAPPALGKSFIIELLCKLYSREKILVITCRSPVLSDLHERIAKRVPEREVIKVASGSPFVDTAEIAVCSARSLHHIDTEWPDILLFDEVHGAAAPNTGASLARFTKPRMFGFSASPEGRSDSADLMTEAFFGQVICNINYAEAQKNKVVCPIEVWLLSVKGAEIDRTQPTARDRWNIWRNRTRNERVKEAVEHFPEDSQILILVNTVEHAFFLRRLLPDFTTVYATLNEKQRSKFANLDICSEDEPLQLDRDKIKAGFRDGSIKKVIATTTWREGVDFPDLKVLIRADGTKGPIPATQIGGRLSRISEDKTKGIVVDFWDDFGNCFLNRSKNRLKNYQKEGWTIVKGYGDL